MTAAAGLGRGERAPDMVLASRDGTPTRYYAHAGGRPALLVLGAFIIYPAIYSFLLSFYEWNGFTPQWGDFVGLENLARTLSIEWARFAVSTVAIAPGPDTSAAEMGALVAYLCSAAAGYFSGCVLDLTGPAVSSSP